MSKTIAVVNQKGGVGKTTSTVNLAAAIASKGYKVLIVDIDPQGNATSGLGVNKRDLKKSAYDILINNMSIFEVIYKTGYKNLWVIPSNMNLAGAEIELVDIPSRESRLKKALTYIKDQFDYILMDCPPSLGLITLNALCAADSVLVPIQCEYYALEGLAQLMTTIRQVKKMYNPLIDIEGVLLTMFDGRLKLTMQVANELKQFFPRKVYKTAIPRNVKLSEAPSYGQPIMYYDKASKGSQAYDELADEFLKNNRRGAEY